MNFSKKHIKTLVIAITITSFAFFCGGLRLGVFAMPGHIMPGASADMEMMPCCAMEVPASQMNHDYLPMLTSLEEILKAILLSLAGFSLILLTVALNKQRIYALKQDFHQYMVHLRHRYGSWQILDHFRQLFRIGILHPKTW